MTLVQEPATGTPTRSAEWPLIVLASTGHALCHIAELLFTGVLVAVQQEFALSKRLATAIPVVGWILMGVGAIPAGLLTDRYSPRAILIAYFAAVAGAGLWCAASGSVWGLVAGLTVMGAAVSLYHPAGLALLSLGCRRKGRAMGIHGVAGSVGITVGPAFGLWMAQLGHWRWAYLTVAAVAGAAALLLSCSGAGRGIGGRRPGSDRTRQPGEQPADSTRSLLGYLLPLYAAVLLGGLCYRSFTTALPTLLKQSLATSALGAWAAIVLTMVPLALGSVGQFFGGRWADRVRPERLYVLLIALSIPAAIGVALAPTTALAVAAASLLALVQFAEQPVENAIIAHVTPARHRSTYYSLKFVLGFGVGALGSSVAGEVWQRTGSLAPVFLVIAGFALAMLAAAVIFARLTGRRRSTTVGRAPAAG